MAPDKEGYLLRAVLDRIFDRTLSGRVKSEQILEPKALFKAFLVHLFFTYTGQLQNTTKKRAERITAVLKREEEKAQ